MRFWCWKKKRKKINDFRILAFNFTSKKLTVKRQIFYFSKAILWNFSLTQCQLLLWIEKRSALEINQAILGIYWGTFPCTSVVLTFIKYWWKWQAEIIIFSIRYGGKKNVARVESKRNQPPAAGHLLHYVI